MKTNKEKTAEELYQEFRSQGYTHQEARTLALKIQEMRSR
jgi:hypothetical protein